jgi:hypothetical protein
MNKPPRPPPRQSPPPASVQMKVGQSKIRHTRTPPVAPPAYHPQPTPKVLQRMTAVNQPSPKTDLKRQPVAPPAYQPQPKPRALQPKAPSPAAPPVYRPQPAPKVLQRKSAGGQPQPGAGGSPRRPVAPPVYRPGAGGVAQPKTGVVSRPPSGQESRRVAQQKERQGPPAAQARGARAGHDSAPGRGTKTALKMTGRAPGAMSAGRKAGGRSRGQTVQRMPVIPDGMEPERHISAQNPTIEEFNDYLDSFVVVPMDFLEAYHDVLDQDERDSTLVKFKTLMKALARLSPAGNNAVGVYALEWAGPRKLAALSAVAARIDVEIGAALDDHRRRKAAREEERRRRQVDQEFASIPVELNDTFLIVSFRNIPTGTNCWVRASMLRHGLWSMEDSHPEDLNSVLLPSVRCELIADGKDLGEQLSVKREWYGRGHFYKVKSGRVYEVDGTHHFFPVSGPGVVSLSRSQYMITRAVVNLFHSHIGTKIREATSGEQLFKLLGEDVPVVLTSALSQIRNTSSGFAVDATVDNLVGRHVKPYTAKSITWLLADFEAFYSKVCAFDEAREKRKAEKAKEVAQKERLKNLQGSNQ